MGGKGNTTAVIIMLTLVFLVIMFFLYQILGPVLPWLPFGHRNIFEDQVENWKVYQNLPYSFSFKYPETWFASGRTPSSGFVSFSSPGNDTELAMMVYKDRNYESVEDFLKTLDRNRSTAYNGRPSVEAFKEQKIKISKTDAVKRSGVMASGGFPVMEAYLEREGVVYGFIFYLYRNQGETITGEQIDLFDQILTTFIFIDPFK